MERQVDSNLIAKRELEDIEEITKSHTENIEQSQSQRRSERISAGVKKPERYALMTKKLYEGKHNDEERNAAIRKAKFDELRLVFEDLKALEPIRKCEIVRGIKPLGTHLFTIEKFKADGSHDKFKSRLVSHGNEQDAQLYPDRYSPTIGIHTIMTGLALVASNSKKSFAFFELE